MPVRRRVHAGQVYLGEEVLSVLGIKDGDEVELEVRDGEVVLRPVRAVDSATIELIDMLKNPRVEGGHEDYSEEYDYEDVSVWN